MLIQLCWSTWLKVLILLWFLEIRSSILCRLNMHNHLNTYILVLLVAREITIRFLFLLKPTLNYYFFHLLNTTKFYTLPCPQFLLCAFKWIFRTTHQPWIMLIGHCNSDHRHFKCYMYFSNQSIGLRLWLNPRSEGLY